MLIIRIETEITSMRMSDRALKVIENIRMLLHLNPFPGRSMGDGFFY